jgi:phosphomevalonate kinase
MCFKQLLGDLPNNFEVEFELYGDLSFYSHRHKLLKDQKPYSYDSLHALNQTTDLKTTEQHINLKTGLGSSAAMIVSFTTAWYLAVHGKSEVQDDQELRHLHIVCQVVNACIQNKIGSGFDIACALYGSQVFSRFSEPELLLKVVEALKNGQSAEQELKEFTAHFDFAHRPFTLPPNVDLLMVDVNDGSDTKVLVKQVLNWDKTNRDPNEPDKMFSGYLF